MSKLRVYMVAKDLGMDNKSLVALFQSLGVADVRNHLSAVGPEQVERVKRHLAKQSEAPSKPTEQRVRGRGGAGGVIIRRGKKRSGSEEGGAAKSEPAPAKVAKAKAPSAEPAAPPWE